MAGKKKHVDDGVQSKTSRASSLKKGGKKEGFVPAAPEHMNRIISLNGGLNCYLLDPRDGKTHHLKVNSEKYHAILDEIFQNDEHATNIKAELEVLGW